MRETLLVLFRSPIQVGLGAAAVGIVLLLVALLFSAVRWMRYFGVSLTAASIVALLPTLIAYGWASSAAKPGGGDFSGFGFLFVPIIFYIIWLLALPVFFLIAVSSPIVLRLGRNEPHNNTRNA